MYVTSTTSIHHRGWRNGSQPRPTTDQALEEADRVVDHFVHRGVLRPESRATRQVRMIFAAPPEALRVSRIARRVVYASRRTLTRYFRVEGLPPTRDWVILARAVQSAQDVRERRVVAASGVRGRLSRPVHDVPGDSPHHRPAPDPAPGRVLAGAPRRVDRPPARARNAHRTSAAGTLAYARSAEGAGHHDHRCATRSGSAKSPQIQSWERSSGPPAQTWITMFSMQP